MYPEELVKPMKEDLVSAGFNELLTPQAVEDEISKPGSVMIMINSVCGCSAGNARPAAKFIAMQNEFKKPDRFATSFAGFDLEAVNQLRKHLVPYPPSSPCIALFKDGELQTLIERHQIEGNSAQGVANLVIDACKSL